MEQVLMNGGQLLKFLTTLEQKGATPESVQRAIESGVLADVFDPGARFNDRDAIRIALKLGSPHIEAFRITINYNLSLEKMIAAGKYNGVSPDITAERFPVGGKGFVEYEVKIFYFDYIISSKEAVEAITSADTANPWEPGKIEHLLAFEEEYPKGQCEYSIIALGSSCGVSDGHRVVPCLEGGGSKRNLDLSRWIDGWHGVYRFLAVRKVSGS